MKEGQTPQQTIRDSKTSKENSVAAKNQDQDTKTRCENSQAQSQDP